MLKITKIKAALGLASLFIASVAPAANITWGATGIFTDNTVLALAGPAASEVYGVDSGGSGAQTTANGYTFADYGTSGNVSITGGPASYDGFFNDALGNPVSTGDAAMDNLLKYGIYGPTMPGTLNNLTVGSSYTAIAILADTRGVHPQTDTFNVSDGVTTSPDQVYSFSGGSPAVGGYIIGTFTATETTQTFTVHATGGGQYNAILVISNPPPLAPLPILISDTQPAFASAGVGGQAAFTAAFSNSPPVSLQWQFVSGGVTNPVTAANAAVVTETNNGVVSSTLMFTNLQVANSGSYLIEGVNATNSLGVTYSSAAPLAVGSLIQWLQTGILTDNTVLALSGTAANEAYGVDFGGSGLQTTANGYTFDDYGTTGNMNVNTNYNPVNDPGIGIYNNYLGGGGSTGDAAMDNILNYGLYGGDAGHVYQGNIPGTLNNLTIGQTYNVIAMMSDTRGLHLQTSTFHVTDGVFTSPNQVFSFSAGMNNATNAIGGYIIGTFTASATNQTFTVNAADGGQYNAILLVKTTAPLLPPIYLAADIQPATASLPEGRNVVFTAAFANYYALNNQQWLFITNGVTNNINAGVVNVTNLGIVTSTLTLNNLQVTESGSYQLKAVNATNSSDVAYSSVASLTVNPTISWEATGTFTDNTVLALAGTPADKVYGVDFGGSGAQTTSNGYTFADNVTSGNISIAGGTASFDGYLAGVTATGDAAFDTLLRYGLYNSGPANTGTLNNLTIGQKYTVLVLLDDTRPSPGPSPTFTVTDGVTTSSSQQFEFANGYPSVGGYIIGTFTATATTQALSVQNGGNSQYNAILLEKFTATPPTPPTLGTPRASGGNLILTGSGGAPNAGYTWLTTTNLSAPINWTTNSTGTLDGAGAFSNAIPINSATRSSFFRLRMP
jgi:hypothetical protein